MTDFYSVLRTALDRVGAASNDQRDRVYDHVREVMVRKLRNHRPPVGETEIASRIVAFEAAIERIETEIAEEEEAERFARERARRAERRQVPAYETTMADEEDANYDDPPSADEDEYLDEPRRYADRDRRYADPDYEEPADEEEPSGFGEEGQGPEPMWGVPAIDMAWDETREQWRDVRRPPDAFAEADSGWDRTEDPGRTRPPRGRRGFLGRGQRSADDRAEPDFAVDPDGTLDPEERDDDDFRVERTTATRPSGRRRKGLAGRLFSSRSRSPVREAEVRSDDESSEPPRRGRKAKADRREASRQAQRAKTSRRAERRRGRAEVEENDPIAALASKLEASRNGYERSEPLLLEPPSTGNGLYLPSPDHLAADGDEDDFEERPRERRRSRRDKRGKRETRRERREQALAFEDNNFDEETEEPSPRRARGRREKRPSRRELRRQRREADRFEASPGRRRIWIGAIFVVAAGVLAWSAYVILPGLFPGDPDEPGANTAAAVETPTPATPTPAPVTPVPTGDGIVMFAGDDPSVFETGADNPINYQADGRFVRITSSINTGGAKLIIDPAVASALAGHQVRVVIEARGAPDQAAAAVRLAYQQDLLILDWRLARLIGEFAIITATWTVPARSTEGSDRMLIEPGVAGDGTAIDIRNIRFEVLD